MSFEIKSLNVRYAKKKILHNIDINNIPAGSFVSLIGPNAAGKSTLFKAIAGMIPAHAADIKLADANLQGLSREERIKRICYLPQLTKNTANLTVFETILLARESNHRWTVSDGDIAKASQLISEFQLERIAHKNMNELSGGQQQLASICQMLMRKSQLYLLDEPTSALDIHRELQVLHELKKRARESGAIMLVSLHNLTIAAKFSDQLIVINNGNIDAHGSTEDVVNSGVIDATYGIKTEVLRSMDGSPVIIGHNR